MAWIELHQTLPRHPKLLRLANRLRIHPAQAAGHLTFLWLWALDYAPTGDLSALAPAEISAAASFPGDADGFAKALTECGWQDPDGRIHDWDEYAGRLIGARTRNKNRMREARERVANKQGTTLASAENVQRTCNAQPQHDTDTSQLCVGLQYSTVPNQEETPSHARARGLVDPSNPPTLEDVAAWAELRGIPGEVVLAWYGETDGRMWVDAKGQPIGRWQSALNSYAVKWRANQNQQKQKHANNRKAGGPSAVDRNAGTLNEAHPGDYSNVPGLIKA